MRVIDYHMHTHFSGDSEANPREHVLKAIEMNLDEICFTDHRDFDYPIDSFELDVENYYQEIQSLKEEFKDQIKIKWGIEMGLDLDHQEEIENLIQQYPFDFVIGSIHVIHHTEFYYGEFFKGKTKEQAHREFFEETLKYILVQIVRIKNGNEIVEYDKRFDLLGSYDEYNLSQKIKVIVEENFDTTLNEYETLYLTLPLVSGNAAPISKFMSNKPQLRENISDLMEKIFKEIYIRMGIIISDQTLRDNLGYHLEFTLNRLLFNIKLKNILLEDMKENYVLPYNLAKISADVIENVYNLVMPEDEIGYIAIHFGSYLEKNIISNTLQKVAIVCSTGLGATNLITIRIRKIIGGNVEIDTFSIFDIDKVNLSQYDLVFTTSDIDINSNSVLKIDTILDESKLRNKIEKMIYLNNSNLSKNLNNVKLADNLIVGVFLHEKYFSVLNNKTISAALKNMIDKMMQDGVVGEKFKKDILEREKSHPTIFKSGLLLPHSVNDKSNELCVSIGVLQKPIQYQGIEIKIIMLIAFSGDDLNSDLLVKVYEEALSIGQNEKYINQLSKCRDFYDLTRTLLKISIK